MCVTLGSGHLVLVIVALWLAGCGEDASTLGTGGTPGGGNTSTSGGVGASAGGAAGSNATAGTGGVAAGSGGAGAGPFVLSPDNPTGQDEDPAVLREQDDAISVAWYSNRNGLGPDGREDKEVFLARTTDATTWSAPQQLTSHPTEWSFYPSLAQSQDGVVHLAWWLMTLTPAGCTPGVDCAGNSNTIMYNSAPDWASWDLDAAEAISTGPGDWLPSIVYDSVGDRIFVYFAAVARNAQGAVMPSDTTLRIFALIRDSGGWSEALPLAGDVNAAGTHNSYPQVAQRADGTFLMTWTRYDGSGGSDVVAVISEPSTQTMFATSADGLTWAEPLVMSGEGLDVFPYPYADHDGTWFATWLTTAFSAEGDQVELAIDGTFPGDLVMRPEIAGYTGKIVATAMPGVFFGASVTGSSPAQKIEGHFFAK